MMGQWPAGLLHRPVLLSAIKLLSATGALDCCCCWLIGAANAKHFLDIEDQIGGLLRHRCHAEAEAEAGYEREE